MPKKAIIDGRKECTRCGELKPLSEFSKKGKCKDGSQKYQSRCKSCWSVDRKATNERGKANQRLTFVRELPNQDDISPSIRKAEFLCKCGNTTIAAKNDVKRGHVSSCGCRGVEATREAHSKDIPHFQAVAASNPNTSGITVTGKFMKSGQTYLNVRCDEHGWEGGQHSSNLARGSNPCPECRTLSLGKPLSHFQEMADSNPSTSGLVVTGKLRKGSGTYLSIRCDAHGWEGERHSSNLSNGSNPCPECRTSSKMETLARDICKSIGLVFKEQWRHDTCRHKLTLPFDIAIMGDGGTPKMLIECHGKQHFESVEHFGGQENLEATQRRDAIKKKWASDNGIPLLEIHYSQRDFKPPGWLSGEWFREKLLTELHTAGVITLDQYLEHSKPYDFVESSGESLLPTPSVPAGRDRDGIPMV